MKEIKEKRYASEIRHKGAKYNIKAKCKICGHKYFPRLKRRYKCPSCGGLL